MGALVGALVGPLVGPLVDPLVGPLVGRGSLSPVLCVVFRKEKVLKGQTFLKVRETLLKDCVGDSWLESPNTPVNERSSLNTKR